MSQPKMWEDKRYYSLSYYLKERFGQKIYKLSLNGGMTCPNRDGTLDTRGCIFCSEGGSGDFSSSPFLSITEQIEEAKLRVRDKNTGNKYIAYFQAFTNTYADIKYLRKIYNEAILHPDIIALSIATRPDCLSDEVLELLKELNKLKPVLIELGLQTAKEETAVFIRRGYSIDCFIQAVKRLDEIGIEIVVHIILGLPNETREDIQNTLSVVTSLPIKGIKLQLLHVLKNTDLAMHLNDFHVLTLEEYVDLVTFCIERIPDHIVIHRITGDGPKNLLLAPLWSANKKNVLNQINKALYIKDSWQGKY